MRIFTSPTMEFHVSRQSREKYQFDQSIFGLTGHVLFANFHAARLFAQKMNQKRDLLLHPEQAVQASQINAMGLIDEILHYVIFQYRHQKNPQIFTQVLNVLFDRFNREVVDKTLILFCEEFPPVAVFQGQISVQDYLKGSTNGVPNQEIILEEMIMLWLENENPAFSSFNELFDDTPLENKSIYSLIVYETIDFFKTLPGFGPGNQNLIDLLRSPAIHSPNSLLGQLEFIRTRWGELIGEFLVRLLSSLDFIQEETKAMFLGPGPSLVYEFSGSQFEAERFSLDSTWMPSLTLIAKNIYVWLDQLSKQYQRHMYLLSHIPDEELEKLARWGFTGLWLIGVWERSQASQRIKQLRGNPEAVASAYSIFDYQIARDLGGDEAFADLRHRAWRFGIRLASDMVPNHMGIDSRWVIEHPDWFISLDYSPFPTYSFNGPNLSWDPRVGIYLEDHYYDGTDAAVVFKRVDFWTGSSKYIYHGNDGTSMPWNDTAQLNYLRADVREAVIQTILHVARQFPIIRFDAAMTLAKKHYERLWFPVPGTGGDIASRAEHSMTKQDFDSLFPEEFWREVVDRVAQEIPDTLLLAEAFWMMEGYFVRTLGMHRVYNSAFMNMLRDEKNQDYRLVIKNTLEFDPEILKRYVNFMNNPDERTAVDQFGKGDKYFGISTMMSTMPGLPMFGHGQVEGYTEKYGMEYRRAYWDESPDSYLVDRHEREIFPLLRRRYLFSEVDDFLLYDFYSADGAVNEDVFAYSNRSGLDRSLVIYHNRFAEARGWIRDSAAYLAKTDGQERFLTRKTLGEGLELHDSDGYYIIFRDSVTGLDYIRKSNLICQQGLYIELNAYQYHVFLDFREVVDTKEFYFAELERLLNGGGTPDIEVALREIIYEPLHSPFKKLIAPSTFNDFHRIIQRKPSQNSIERFSNKLSRDLKVFLGKASEYSRGSMDEENIGTIIEKTKQEIQSIIRLTSLLSSPAEAEYPEYINAQKFIKQGVDNIQVDKKFVWDILFSWVLLKNIGMISEREGFQQRSREWFDEWLLGRVLADTYRSLGIGETQIQQSINIIRFLISQTDWADSLTIIRRSKSIILDSWLVDPDIQQFLKINRYDDILWYNKEALEQFLFWMMAILLVNEITENGLLETQRSQKLANGYKFIQSLLKAADKSGYQVNKLVQLAKKSKRTKE